MRSKRFLASYLILLQTAVLLLLIGCFVMDGFDIDQFTTLLAVIVPMLSCYGVAALRYLASARDTPDGAEDAPVGQVRILALALPTVFTVVIAVFLLIQANGSAAGNFEQFKRLMIILEGAFACSLGEVLFSLFRESPAEESRRGGRAGLGP